jgi:D-apionolactonase
MTASPAASVRFAVPPLTARLIGVDLADIRSGREELIRRVGVRVRDRDWGTVPPQIDGLRVEDDGATFDARHERDGIDFAWRARIEFEPGALVYEMDGCAQADFDYNRIGIVVLHPPEVTAGHRYRARTAAGETIAGTLSELIGPQLITAGVVQPLFPAFTLIEIEIEPGRFAAFEFEGDVFEMEDQRNWTDGSFKTYSTPVSLPIPRRARAGERVRQQVRAALPRPARPRAAERCAELRVGLPLGQPFPPLGIGIDSDGHESAGAETELIRGLGPAHLRAELRGDGWQAALERGFRAASAAGAALELALVLDGDEDSARALLEPVAGALRTPAAPLARVLVTYADQRVTTSVLAELARSLLALPGSVPLVGGPAANFAELNRERPGEDVAVDGLAYSITPQVHDSDDESIVQTLHAQRDTVETARSFAGARSIHVSPVTLRPRPSPQAEQAVAGRAAGEPPPGADPRQSSRLAAAWTAASAGQLALGGVASATYYEATGWLGVMERSSARVYPVYHVLRELCAWRSAELLDCRSTDPGRVELVGVTAGSGARLLALNLTPEPLRVSLGPLVCRHVGRATLDPAAEPGRFGGAPEEQLAPQGGWLQLQLGPYDVVRIRQLG